MSALNFKISAQLEAAGFKQASDYMKTLSNETQKNRDANKEHAGTVDALKVAYGALVGLGIVEFFKSAYEEAAQAREQEIQLSARVDQTGLSYEKAKPKLDAFFQSLQDQSGIAKDKLVPAFNELIDKTQSVRESQQLMTTTMGFARARGIDLASAATLIAGAYNGASRETQHLARMMGMTTEQAKDHEKVIAMAKDRYSQFATNADQAAISIARFQNAMKDSKEQIGAGFSGPLADIATISTKILLLFKAMMEGMGVLAAEVSEKMRIRFEEIGNYASMGFKKAHENAQREMKILADTTDEEMKKIGESIDKALRPRKADPGDNLVDGTIAQMQRLNDAMEVLMAEGRVASAKNDDDKLEAQQNLIDAQNEAFLNQLEQQEGWEKLSVENRNEVYKAQQQKADGESLKLTEEYLLKKTKFYFFAGNQIGISTAKMLRGEQDAWKDALRNIIDMVAQEAEAYVMMAAIKKAANAPNYLLAAKEIAVGVAYSAAIAGAAEVAKGAVGGSSNFGGTASSASSSALSAGGGGAAAAPAASGGGSTLTIYVQGDVVDSDTFMNSLAAKLSSKVENQDIRLIASGVKS